MFVGNRHGIIRDVVFLPTWTISITTEAHTTNNDSSFLFFGRDHFSKSRHEKESNTKIGLNVFTYLGMGIKRSKLVYWRCSVRILSGTQTLLTSEFRCFPLSFRTNAGILHQLCQDWILPNPSPVRHSFPVMTLDAGLFCH